MLAVWKYLGKPGFTSERGNEKENKDSLQKTERGQRWASKKRKRKQKEFIHCLENTIGSNRTNANISVVITINRLKDNLSG